MLTHHKVFLTAPPPPQVRQHAPDNHILDLVVICMLSPLQMWLLCVTLLLLGLCMATLMDNWMANGGGMNVGGVNVGGANMDSVGGTNTDDVGGANVDDVGGVNADGAWGANVDSAGGMNADDA